MLTTELKLKAISKLNGKPLIDLVEEAICLIIERHVKVSPFIAWVSKGQLFWGWNGEKGVKDHFKLARPTDQDRMTMELKYGYALKWPPPKVYENIGITMRKRIVQPMLKGDPRFMGVGIAYGAGKVNTKPPYNILKDSEDYPGVHQVVGWFLYMRDPQFRSQQDSFMVTRPIHERLQLLRVQETFEQVVTVQVESGVKKTQFNELLRKQLEFKEINPGIKQEDIPWHKKKNNIA